MNAQAPGQATAAAQDTLGFFLFLAFALHLIIILGVGFSFETRRTTTPQLEVTLTRQHSDGTPDKSRFIAQANQLGSGDTSEPAELTARQQALFNSDSLRETSAAPRQTTVSEEVRQERVTSVSTSQTRAVRNPQPEPEPLKANGSNPQAQALTQHIASLEARLEEQDQAFAERPRVRRLTSLSAQRSVDARYLYYWRTRVETIGNQHYPEASSRDGIYGDLRLLVAIQADGSIDNIAILSSSGHPVLDEAAIRIVRMAAPYEPFPPELRATTDKLEIIRTWKFRQNRLSSVQG
jgi:protein TonB